MLLFCEYYRAASLSIIHQYHRHPYKWYYAHLVNEFYLTTLKMFCYIFTFVTWCIQNNALKYKDFISLFSLFYAVSTKLTQSNCIIMFTLFALYETINLLLKMNY